VQPHVGRHRVAPDRLLLLLRRGRVLGHHPAEGGLRCRPRRRQERHARLHRDPGREGAHPRRLAGLGPEHGGDAGGAKGPRAHPVHRPGGGEPRPGRGHRSRGPLGRAGRARGCPRGEEAQSDHGLGECTPPRSRRRAGEGLPQEDDREQQGAQRLLPRDGDDGDPSEGERGEPLADAQLAGREVGPRGPPVLPSMEEHPHRLYDVFRLRDPPGRTAPGTATRVADPSTRRPGRSALRS